MIGARIAGYRIEKMLGAGGMGEVYLGRHPMMDRLVAIKLMPAVPEPPADLVERFYREARAMASLNHPGIVRVYDVGRDGEWYYIRMQFIDALSLERIVRINGPAPPLQAIAIVRDIADAMSAAHASGILHRDLKPGNILFVESSAELKVIDFGLARIESAQQLTVQGAVMGTPYFVAPEQAAGITVDGRADIYSLGALAYFLLAGKPPYAGRTPMDIILEKRNGVPAPSLTGTPGVPTPMVRLVERLCEVQPDDRPPTMAAVCELCSSVLEAAAAGSEDVAAGMPQDRRRGLAAGMAKLRELLDSASARTTTFNAAEVENIEASLRVDADVLASELDDIEETMKAVPPVRDWSLSIDRTRAGDRSAPPPPPLPLPPPGSQTGHITVAPYTTSEHPGDAADPTWVRHLDGMLDAALDVDEFDPTVAGAPRASGRQPGVKPAQSGRLAPLPKRLGFAQTIQLGDAPDGGGGAPGTQSIRRIGGYAVQSLLGKGGMGEVLAVRDPDLNRHVAMKLMLGGEDAGQSQLDKFLIEAQVTGQLEHPNIVPVHELGMGSDGRVYFTMKLVRGRSYNRILTEMKRRREGMQADETIGDFHLRRRLDIFLRVCDAMAFAHSRGVVHRDLKPENIMVGEFGEVQVMDWGLAKIVGMDDRLASDFNLDLPFLAEEKSPTTRPGSGSGSGSTSMNQPSASGSQVEIDLTAGAIGAAIRGEGSDTTMQATLDGTVMGTPMFMPPEQAMGNIAAIDHRSDIYSLGAILYQLVTLETPLEKGETLIATLSRVARGEITPPSERVQEHVSPELEAVILKAMSLQREDRYQSVLDLQRDIRAWQEGHLLSAMNYSMLHRASKWVRRNRALVIAAAAVVLVAVGVLIGVVQWQESQRAAQIATFLEQGATIVKAAEADLDGGHDEAAQNQLAEALTRYDSVLALDPFHPAGKTGRDHVRDLVRDLKQSAEERQQRQQQEEKRLALLAAEKAAREKEQAEAAQLVAQARAKSDEARTALDDVGAHFGSLSDEQLASARKSLDGLHDTVVSLLGQAEAKAGDSRYRQLAIEAAAARRSAQDTLDRQLEARDQRREANKSLTEANEAFTAGDQSVTDAKALDAAIAAMPADQRSEKEAELERLRAAAIDRLLTALGAYRRALDKYAILKDDAGRGAASAGERKALVSLTHHAMQTRQFQLAGTFLGQAIRAAGEPLPDELAALRDELETLLRKVRGYDTALAAGDTAFEARAFDAALTQYRAAQGLDDTPEIRARIQRAEYEAQLDLAATARDERRWLDANGFYDKAAAIATNAEQRAQLDLRRDDLLSRATADLLARARALMETNTEAARRDAAGLLTILLTLVPDNEDALRLQTELAAMSDAPEGFVYVGAGRANLGSNVAGDRNPARFDDVAAFYIATREVTVREYAAFIEAGGYTDRQWWSDAGWACVEKLTPRRPADWATQQQTPGLPVVGVSAYEAMAFAKWLGAQGSDTRKAACRLPTDAEWELVARHSPADRSGPGRKFPWGDTWESGGLVAETDLHASGSISADRSAFGCLDMGGNAAEWVIRADTPDSPDSFGVRGASNRMRGSLAQWFATTTKRGFAAASQQSEHVGFRLVRPIGAK
ncbi:MAG: protein kinase [Planctomycetota bacterium]